MKRLSKEAKNSGLNTIEFNSEESKEFNNKLFTALRKFGSGRKTKAVHKLIDHNLIIPAIFGGQATDSLVAPATGGTSLKAMLMNAYHYDDSVGARGTVTYAMERISIDKDIHKEETFVNDARLHNIEKLNAKRKEVTDKLLNSFDYIKLIDGAYFGWLLFMADTAIHHDEAAKPKIVTTGADILASILKKLYKQVNSKIDPDVHQLIEAIAIYFFKIYFYGETASYALNSLKKAFKEDIIEAIERAKVTKFNEFGDLAKILKETELMPITNNTFDMQMERMFGKIGYREYVSPSLVTFLAFMANLAQPNGLFKDSYSVDDEVHTRLEELLLNEQKKVTIKDNK